MNEEAVAGSAEPSRATRAPVATLNRQATPTRIRLRSMGDCCFSLADMSPPPGRSSESDAAEARIGRRRRRRETERAARARCVAGGARIRLAATRRDLATRVADCKSLTDLLTGLLAGQIDTDTGHH